MISRIKFSLIIIIFSSFCQLAEAKKFATKYCEFELPAGWECVLEGLEWVCQSSSKERKKLSFNKISDRFFSAYLRFEVLDKSGVLSNITNIFSKNNVSIKRLIQNPNKNKGSSSIIIITHKSKDKFLSKIISVVGKKSYITKKPKLIRINDN